MNANQPNQPRFEDRLLDELKSLIVAHPSARPARRPRTTGWGRRLALVGGTAAVLAVVAAAGVPFLIDGGTPAYAVSRNDDGTVTVEITSLRDAAGLERELEEAGVPAVVHYLPSGKACKEGWFTPATAGGDGRSTSTIEETRDGHTRFTIGPGMLPADGTLVIQTQGDPAGASSIAIAVAQGEVGPCEVVDAPGGIAPPPGGAQPAAIG